MISAVNVVALMLVPVIFFSQNRVCLRHRHDEYNKLDFSVYFIIFAYRLQLCIVIFPKSVQSC